MSLNTTTRFSKKIKQFKLYVDDLVLYMTTNLERQQTSSSALLQTPVENSSMKFMWEGGAGAYSYDLYSTKRAALVLQSNPNQMKNGQNVQQIWKQTYTDNL